MHYFDLSHFAILKISGDDAYSFLSAQFTCDLAELEKRDWLFAGWCMPNGRTITTFILFRHARDFYLILPAMLTDKVMQRLSMFVLRSAVTIEDCSDDITLLGLAGERAESIAGQLPGDRMLAVLEMWGQDPRYFICCPNDAVENVMNLLASQCEEGDRSGWSLLDIEAGMPWIINATTEQYLPQMLNLDRAAGLSYKKGCYPGQEVIARLYYRGQLKKRLYQGTADSSTTSGPGDRLETGDKEYAGDVIDAERCPGGGFRFLAVVNIEQGENNPLFIHADEDNIPVTVTAIQYPA